MSDFQSAYKGSIHDAVVLAVTSGKAGIQGVKLNNSEIKPDSENKVNLNIPNVLQQTGTSTTDTMSQDAVTKSLNLKATLSTYQATLLASNWSELAPYTQTVSIDGILANDKPIADVVLSDNSETAITQNDNWVAVSKISTAENSIVATCLQSKPTVDLNIQLIVLR